MFMKASLLQEPRVLWFIAIYLYIISEDIETPQGEKLRGAEAYLWQGPLEYSILK